MIKNEPKKYVGDYDVDAVRDAYENRGRWYYFLVKQGLEQGLSLDFARDAMRESGLFLGKNRFAGIDNLKDFANEFMTFGVEKVNEGEIVKLTEEEFEVELGYCPLVNAWMNLDQDEKFLADICDICMDMDRGLAGSLGMSMDLKTTIASGGGKCTMCFKKQSHEGADGNEECIA